MKLRTETALLNEQKSRTEKELPSLTRPYVDSVLPSRAKHRRLKPLPKDTKSSTPAMAMQTAATNGEFSANYTVQSDIDANLACLPVFLAGCKQLLMLAGTTRLYAVRSWSQWIRGPGYTVHNTQSTTRAKSPLLSLFTPGVFVQSTQSTIRSAQHYSRTGV